MQSEKRKSLRVPVAMNVSGEENSNTLGFGYAQNISEAGMAIDAQALADGNDLPSTGAEIRMRFKLPKGALVITATGRVVRVDNSGKSPLLAVEFVALPHEFQSELRDYIYHLTKV
jgi:hypothetical protein